MPLWPLHLMRYCDVTRVSRGMIERSNLRRNICSYGELVRDGYGVLARHGFSRFVTSGHRIPKSGYAVAQERKRINGCIGTVGFYFWSRLRAQICAISATKIRSEQPQVASSGWAHIGAAWRDRETRTKPGQRLPAAVRLPVH